MPPWMVGTELAGKTLGVVGLGMIGQKVARIGQGFGMRVVAHDPLASRDTFSAHGVEPVDLEELFPMADFLTLHVPLTPETAGMVNATRLGRMKPSAYLINTSRGAVVDQAALIEALCAGRIAGAGLDVFAEEPLPPDSPLLRMDNVVLTPHMGASTWESVAATSLTMARQAVSILRGEKPSNLVR